MGSANLRSASLDVDIHTQAVFAIDNRPVPRRVYPNHAHHVALPLELANDRIAGVAHTGTDMVDSVPVGIEEFSEGTRVRVGSWSSMRKPRWEQSIIAIFSP